MNTSALSLLMLLAIFSGCASSKVIPQSRLQPPDRLSEQAEITIAHGDRKIGTYVSSPWGFSTSSYWIEGPEGLVMIDTQFLPSAAQEALDWAEKITSKKVVMAIVLHPNPDKFNGTLLYQKRGIRVLTSQQVRDLIPSVHKLRHEWFYDRYKPDYPEQVPLPESFGNQTREISAAGLVLKVHVLGPGCSGAHVVVEFESHVFTGDLVTNNAHSWLEIGKTDQWLKRLKEIEALKPEFVHPGRGPSGGPELLVKEDAYLRKVIEIVGREHPHMPVNDAAIERIQAKVEAAYPGYRFGKFLELGLPAEWERQARLGKR